MSIALGLVMEEHGWMRRTDRTKERRAEGWTYRDTDIKKEKKTEKTSENNFKMIVISGAITNG